jgi:catalase
MRTDANSGSKPRYFPSSYHSLKPQTGTAPGFGGAAHAESAYQVGDNVVSRRGHYRQEGKTSEYDQVRELYRRCARAVFP